MPRNLEDGFEKLTGTSDPLKNPGNLLELSLSGLSHLDLTGHVTFNSSEHPKHRGGFGDVHTGTYESPDRGNLTVAIKCLRRFNQGEAGVVEKIAAKEIYIWSKLMHPNLLRLEGFIREEGTILPSLVSEWMEGGSVLEYVKKHSGCDVLHLILGIAEGLEYLHSSGVVHSDLKSDNVLVSKSGDAVICDFGISRAMNATQFALGGNTTRPSGPAGTIRWMAHELVAKPDTYTKHTKESDVWAFGMTTYELLTTYRPYAHITRDLNVSLSVMRGELPPQPESLEAWPKKKRKVWDLLQSCWVLDPPSRVKIDDVFKQLKVLRSTHETGKTPSNDGTSLESSSRSQTDSGPKERVFLTVSNTDVDNTVTPEGEVQSKPDAEDLTSPTLVAKAQEQKKMTSDDTVVPNSSLPTQMDSVAYHPEKSVTVPVLGEPGHNSSVDPPSVFPVEDTPEIFVEGPTVPVIARDFGIKGTDESLSNDSISPEAPGLPLLTGAVAKGNSREGAATNGAKEEKQTPSPEKPRRVTPKETKRSKPGFLSIVFGGCSSLLCR
ncbi:hypothetical protein M0805_001131 [Coniferiporia weirii]|nr:hypothetical protein M0805_001131 [Coniferiporia weirii]